MILLGVLVAITLSVVIVATVRRRAVGEREEEREHLTGDTSGKSKRTSQNCLCFPNVTTAVAFVVFSAVAVGAAMTLVSKDGRYAPRAPFTCTEPTVDERLDLIGEPRGVDQKISTKDPKVQRLFNQGLMQRWGFNDYEAARSFKLATELDPDCAMCWWGLAYAAGPHPNKVPVKGKAGYPSFNTDNLKESRDATSKALDLAKVALDKDPSDTLLKKELGYIEAFLVRFPDVEEVTKQRQFQAEVEYAAKMLDMWVGDRDDLSAAGLAVEALMNLSPWSFHYGATSNKVVDKPPSEFTWDEILLEAVSNIRGEPETNSVEVSNPAISVSEFLSEIPEPANANELRVEHEYMKKSSRLAEEIILRMIDKNPLHPLANHLHIHVTEAAPPGLPGTSGAARGFESAEKLRELAAPIGHLIHMPSHTYVRVGRYKDSVDANIDAFAEDVKQAKKCISPYVAEHNLDLLVFGASMGGMLDSAEKYYWEMNKVPELVPGVFVAPGHEYVSILLVWTRFGQWDKILGHYPPPKDARGASSSGGFEYSKVIWHWARFMALSHTLTEDDGNGRRLLAVSGDLDSEMDALKEAVEKVPEHPQTEPGDSVGIFGVPHIELSRIKLLEAEARMAILNGKLSKAKDPLKEAIKLSIVVGYMEPPRVHQPVQQCLGWLYLKSKNYPDAKAMFDEDLREYPENPWSLFGLSKLFAVTGKDSSTAEDYMKRYKQAWQGTPMDLTSSCPMLFD